jgi:hypothetical protein
VFIFCNPTDDFDVGVDPCSLSLAILATFFGNAICWKKAYLHHDGGNMYFACRV